MKKTNVKSGKRKIKITREKLFLLIIVLVIVIAVIIGVVVINGNKTTNGDNNGDLNGNAGTTENTNVDNGLIDMNNTQNAKVENGVKENVSEKLKEEKTFESLVIKDINLSAQGGVTRFTATVENKGGDITDTMVVIRFVNEDGSDYAQLEVLIPTVKAGETTSIDASTTADIANAYNFTIERM